MILRLTLSQDVDLGQPVVERVETSEGLRITEHEFPR